MKIKRPTLTGPVRYLGHFAGEKVLRDGHNTNGTYDRRVGIDPSKSRNDSDPGARGQELEFMYPPQGTRDRNEREPATHPDDKMVKKAGEHTGEMNHPKNPKTRRWEM